MKRLWYIIKCFLFANSPERKFKNWYEGLRNSAIEWNATTLTENTLSMQVRKICEEICEVLDAQTREEVIKEKADVLIAIWGLNVFDPYIGMLAEKLFVNTNDGFQEILEVAESKITELHKRTYVKDGKVYRHTEKQQMLN
jgi:hypothetical protein